MRNYTQPMIDGLKADYPRTDLIEIQFSNATLYLTTCTHDIIGYDGNDWISGHIVAGSPRVKFDKDLKVVNIPITLSGVDDIIGIALSDNQRNRKVIIKMIILDPVDNTPLGTLLESYYLIDKHSQEVDLSTNSFDMNITNYLSEMLTTRGIRTTQASHALYFPGSTSFLNSKDVSGDLNWGSD